MKIVIEGCGHGVLDKIYEAILHLQRVGNVTIDLLICCGDFQAVRNEFDLNCMSVPHKYREMGDFYKYYSGEAVAPIPTLWIHGNHEAGNHLQELSVLLPLYLIEGANMKCWVITGVVEFGGLKFGGISGIYKHNHYQKGYSERIPYNGDSVRSIYHVRSLEVFKLKQYTQPIDVFLSHDWPTSIYYHGDTQDLLRRKQFFEEEVRTNTLGSPANEELLKHLAPKFWFSAHLHVKFAAIYPHPGKVDSNGQPKQTKFLALDKCLPHRDFLQVVDLPDVPGAEKVFKYDEEWLAIVKATMPLYSTSNLFVKLPNKLQLGPARDFMRALVGTNRQALTVPLNFSRVVPAYPHDRVQFVSPGPLQNPQTLALLKLLEIDATPFTDGQPLVEQVPEAKPEAKPSKMKLNLPPPVHSTTRANPEEIDLDTDERQNPSATAAAVPPSNPEEIDLDAMDTHSPAKARPSQSNSEEIDLGDL